MLIFMDLTIRKERSGKSILENEPILLEVDVTLEPFEVIQPKKKLCGIILDDCERTGDVLAFNFHLSCMNPTQNLARTDSNSLSCISLINKPC